MQNWRTLVQAAKHQIYISRIHDPFLNLSIEHYLLQKSSADSTILFLYINKPCVVIGRNQNPWLEVNLELLKKSRNSSTSRDLKDIELVRRRSGGGTVFHDFGNVNYSVICPPATFTRNKHAEMVTKAIRTFNDRARVNERHDIVLDGGLPLPLSQFPSESDMLRSKYRAPLQPLKVSGSAYKVIRNRSLHHGTCLIASRNLASISKYLRSPARAYMKAKGVESVPSPVGNASKYQNLGDEQNLETSPYINEFQTRVIEAFADLYDLNGRLIKQALFESTVDVPVCGEKDWAAGYLGRQAGDVAEVAEGVEELKSSKWIYGQTPQFTLSSHAVEDDDKGRNSLSDELPSPAYVYLKARGGAITEAKLSFPSGLDAQSNIEEALIGINIHEIKDFREILQGLNGIGGMEQIPSVMGWLNMIFAKPD